MSQTTLPGSDIKPWIRPAPQGYKFINANIVDVETGTIKANTTLITTEGKITYIGSESSIPASPISLKTVDCQGKYLCPGLFDAHVHLCAVPGYSDLSKAFGNPKHLLLVYPKLFTEGTRYRLCAIIPLVMQ